MCSECVPVYFEGRNFGWCNPQNGGVLTPISPEVEVYTHKQRVGYRLRTRQEKPGWVTSPWNMNCILVQGGEHLVQIGQQISLLLNTIKLPLRPLIHTKSTPFLRLKVPAVSCSRVSTSCHCKTIWLQPQWPRFLPVIMISPIGSDMNVLIEHIKRPVI